MFNLRFPGVLASELRGFFSLYVWRRPLLLLLIAVAAALWALDRAGRLERPGPGDPIAFVGQPAAVVGIVVEPPDVRPSGCVYILDVETLTPAGERMCSVAGRLLAQVIGSTVTAAAPGDRVRVFGEVRSPEPARSPGAFDYRAYLATKDIHALIYSGPGGFSRLGGSRRHGFEAAGWRLRRAVVDAFERRLPPERAAVMAGLTVGQRPRFYPGLRRAFVDSGTMHVLVASGSNVGFVLAAWLMAAAAFGVPRRSALVSAVPAVWAYVLVVGGDAPIARAGTMATVGIIAFPAQWDPKLGIHVT